MKLSTLQRWISPSLSIQGKIFIAFSFVALLSIFSISGIVYLNMRETIKDNAVTSVSDSIRQADESLNIMLEEIDRLNTVVVTNKNTVIDTLLSPSEEISYEWFQEQKRIDEFLSVLMAVWDRATFQMRDSSNTPAKLPSATPVEFMAVPSAACWILSERGTTPAASVCVTSRLPSR